MSDWCRLGQGHDTIQIIDENLKLQPIGVIGEIAISGVQLAKGYLNDKQKTQEKFVKNPFDTKNRIEIKKEKEKKKDQKSNKKKSTNENPEEKRNLSEGKLIDIRV